ncbi:MAG: hypothetical protein ACJ8AW_19440 [Rhodopila sp.]
MARRTPISYENLNISGGGEEPEPEAELGPPARQLAPPPRNSEAHLVKARSQQVMLYMSPEAHKALARFALEKSTFRNKVKPHDLLIEAVQEWFDRNGLREQVRVQPEKGRGI